MTKDPSFMGNCAAEGYAVGALWDPHLLHAEIHEPVTVRVHSAAISGGRRIKGLEASGPIRSSKETIHLSPGGPERKLHLPCDMQFMRLSPDRSWQTVGRVGQWPLAVCRKGEVVFSLDPTLLLQQHLNMMDGGTTADITDLIVRCILAAAARGTVVERGDLRRDFHSLGVVAHRRTTPPVIRAYYPCRRISG